MSVAHTSHSKANESVISTVVSPVLCQTIVSSTSIVLEDSSHTKYAVKVIGALDKEAIIVEFPKVSEKLAFIKENITMSCKLFNGETYLLFNALVLDTIYNPVPLLVLSYPRSATEIKIRKSKRKELSIIGAVTSKESHAIPCKIVDLSEGGCLFHSKFTDLEVGSDISISFSAKIKGDSAIISLTAKCLRVDLNTNMVGAKFERLSMETKALLSYFIAYS